MLKEKRNSWKKIYIWATIALLISTALFTFSFFIKKSIVLDKKEIPVTLTIGNRTGFNVTNYSVSFGMLSKGNAASRDNILVKNNYGFPIVLELSAEGNTTQFLIFNQFVKLASGEEKNLSISTIKISDEPYGVYSGKLIILFKSFFFFRQ